MKTAILFVGKEFFINEAFCDYVIRNAKAKVINISAIRFLNEKDKDLFLEISGAFEKFENLLIVTSSRSYATTSKIVATLFEDNLVAKDEMVVPSKASQVQKNSFLIQSHHTINLIKADPCTKLPPILLTQDKEAVTFYIFDLSIKDITKRLSPIANSYGIAYMLSELTPGLIKLCAYNKKYGDLSMFVQNAKQILPERLIVTYDIVEYLIEHFRGMGKRITFAESCTGGLLASMLTKVPGSSEVFDGSLVTYSNEVKQAWLGVKQETLQTFGAVSEETVQEMLQGAIKLTQADYAIAISGIAGPSGATPTKPVGTVVVGCKDKEREIIRTMHFRGDRNYIQYQSAMYGIKLIFEIAREKLF